MLRAEGNCKGVVEFVLSHCCDGDVGGVREVGFGSAVGVSQELRDFADTV